MRLRGVIHLSAVDIDNNEAPGSLTHCPFCRYNLQGLPRNYRCPECGVEYDDSMQAWGHRYSSLDYWMSYLSRGAINILSVMPIIFISFQNRPHFIAGAIILALIITISMDKRRGGQNQFIIASSKGVAVANSKKIRKLSWRTFWVPNPDNPKELPPSAVQWNEDLRYRNGLIDILFRVRPGFFVRRATLHKRAAVKWYNRKRPNNNEISLERIGNRKTRKVMMRELRRRWEEANASDGAADEQT